MIDFKIKNYNVSSNILIVFAIVYEIKHTCTLQKALYCVNKINYILHDFCVSSLKSFNRFGWLKWLINE